MNDQNNEIKQKDSVGMIEMSKIFSLQSQKHGEEQSSCPRMFRQPILNLFTLVYM